MKRILNAFLVAFLLISSISLQAQNDCIVITCIDSDGNSNDYDICDGTTDFALLEDCTEILIDGEPLPGFDIDIDNDGLDGYGFDFDSCDFVITCIDADGISTDYDPCDETVDYYTLECVEILIDSQPLFDFDDFDDDYYGYDFDDDFDFDECDIEFECVDLQGNEVTVNLCDTTIDWNAIECDFFIGDDFDWDYYGYGDCDSLDLDDFDFDYYGYDYECDFLITCIDVDGNATDYDACDETLDFTVLEECTEILFDGEPLIGFDDYYGYDFDDDYDYDFDECDIELVCTDLQGNIVLVNICDTTVDWNAIECDFGFDDYDFDYDYDYNYDCTSVITCIDANGVSTDYDPCDETVNIFDLECTELLIDGIPIQDFGDFDFDFDDFDIDFDFPDDSLWFDWDCDTLFTIIIADDIDTLVINPCDEDALEDLFENFDCIYNDTIDCPWDTTGFYIWGNDGREFTPMSAASIVGLDDETAPVSVSTIYPNPTAADFNISINATNASQLNVKVFSVTGQQVSSEIFDVSFGTNNLQMNINGVPNGIYQVYLFEDTKMISTHKLSVVK